MRTILSRIVCVLALAATSLGAHAQQPSDVAAATTWLRHLYSPYEHPPTKDGPGIFAKHPAQIFTPGLLALVRRDVRLAHGEVGNLDYDPICNCQDNDGMKLTQLNVVSTGPHTATASVTLTFPEPAAIQATLLLVLTPNGWRIDEEKTKDVPSLRALLKQPL